MYSDSKYNSLCWVRASKQPARNEGAGVEHTENNIRGWAKYYTLKAEKGSEELTIGSLAQFEEGEYLKK